MSTRPILDPETILVRCEMIRSRWDPKTKAKRRATAAERQRGLAQQLGIGWDPTEHVDTKLQPCVAEAA